MRKLYPSLMSKAKDESIKMAQLAGVEFDGSDFSVLKPYKPKWIESRDWGDMIDRVWNKKSKLWKHRGGSIDVSLLKRRLGNDLLICPTPAEVFKLTHTRRTATEVTRVVTHLPVHSPSHKDETTSNNKVN